MQEELLSKKELLQITGISYGQLYRWKRQNLIPETWFIKQSAFTGQETFFPKEKILSRVQEIMNLKDQYSLEELADMFSPETTGKLFKLEEFAKVEALDPVITARFQQTFNKQTFAFKEILFMYVLSKIKANSRVSETDLSDMVHSIQNWLPRLKNISYRFVVCQRQSQTFSLLLQQDAPLYLDHRISELHVYELDELAKDLNVKLIQMIGGEQ
ncbi:MAG TPA: DUF4004 family protein [Verrucomicrobiae bacterium]|nr:DUF4004 family protein [Verrucomicrobiae bacterium]